MNPFAPQKLWTCKSNVLRCFEASFVVANKPGNSHNELFLQYPGRSLRNPWSVLGQQKLIKIIKCGIRKDCANLKWGDPRNNLPG